MKRIQSGNATFKDTADYSRIYSELLGKCLSENVLDLTDREAAAADILRDSFDHTNSILSQVQTNIDKKNGINIRPQTADFPLERVQQFSHSLTDPTVPDETIQRRARSGTANISMSHHDDYMETNARFRSKAGLKCYIDRQTDGKCCKWCTAIAGRYVYGEEPHDVYRRHDNCGCSVIYEHGRQRTEVWSKRTWEKPKVGAGASPPTKFTPEQARALEQEKLRNIHGLSIDNGTKSDIIEETGETREFNPLPPEKVVPEMRKAFDGWLPSVSGEEYASLVKYTKNAEEKGIKPFFERLNTALRDKVILSDRMKYHSDNISNAINKFNLPHDIVCYRATKKNFFDKYSVGELFYADYFLSSSASRAGALKGKFLTIIRAPKGSRCAYIEKLSLYPSQREVLFDKSCQYRVVEKNEKFMVIEVINND